LEFIPPSLNPLVLRIVQLLLPAWLRFQCSIDPIRADNVEVLVDLYRQFQLGETRFLIAFRHPDPDDPFCMAYLLGHIVPQVARRQGILLNAPVHSYFIYDRGIPLWAGAFVGWLFPRLGGTSIHRGKVDRLGLRAARHLFANGRFPIAAAPEGATNGHSEIVSPLEPGVIQLGFWCMEDLVKAGRSEQVVIVPVGIQYHFVEVSWKRLEAVLEELEKDVGLPLDQAIDASVSWPNKQEVLLASSQVDALYQRLLRLGEHLLGIMEKFYTHFYHQSLAKRAGVSAGLSQPEKTFAGSVEELAIRLQTLLDVALQVPEHYFGLPSKGSLIDRCRRLEQAGWDQIYREDIATLSPLERALADWTAEEASLQLWHMRLVERFTAVTGRYILEKPTADRFAEIILILGKVMAWLKGTDSFHSPDLGKRWVQMTIGEPISISKHWEMYQADRRSAKQAVTDLTRDLQIALEKMIS
jgi:hypothetical protein